MNSKLILVFLSLFFKLAVSVCADGEGSSQDDTCPILPGPLAPREHSCGCAGVFVNTYQLRVVFEWWVCEKTWQYALTLVGLFGFAMMSPCLKAYREILRSKAIRSYVFDCLLTHFILFVFALSVYFLDFLLMLIVMSFNVGVFFAVTTGYAIGYVLSSMAYSTYKHSVRNGSFSRVNEDCC